VHNVSSRLSCRGVGFNDHQNCGTLGNEIDGNLKLESDLLCTVWLSIRHHSVYCRQCNIIAVKRREKNSNDIYALLFSQ
jgi:hypothetical protein